MTPILTIGMPVFNDVDFLEQSLESILNQTENRFLLIISDDASTDGSALICKKFAERDNRIVYIRQERNLGISKNMEFLLKEAKTSFFMWAGDDDLLHPDFIKSHINKLKTIPTAIVSFGQYEIIDEENNTLQIINADYSSRYKLGQLLKLMFLQNDGFGYGVFRTEMIRGVRFPVWWWPNQKTPYNNIYPSLLYYLNNGKYVHIPNVLFYKRQKEGRKVNHVLAGKGNGIKELFAFYLRRFYLVHYGFSQMIKSKTWVNAFMIYPFLLINWFCFSSLELTVKSMINKIKKI